MNFKQDFGMRVVAFIIDSVIISIGVGLVKGLGAFTIWNTGFELGYRNLSDIVFFGFYFIGFAYFKNGETFGKLATNQVIRKANGDALGRDNMIKRELVKTVLMPIALISVILAAFREDHKSLHDLVFDTMVFSEKESQVEPPKKEKDIFDDYEKRSDDFYE